MQKNDILTECSDVSHICNTWFWVFFVVYIVGWVVVHVFVNHALPHDAIETFMWGMHLEWGYDKHPWVTPFAAHLIMLVNRSSWFIYTIAYFISALGIYFIWQVAKEIFHPVYAFAAAAIYFIVYFYTAIPSWFNVHLFLFLFYPLITLLFYRAIKTQKITFWILVGFFAGLAMMSKYVALLLFIAMFAFLLVEPKARINFRKPGVYIALIVFFVVIFPNVYWLFQHDFISIRFPFFEASGGKKSLISHLINPYKFIQVIIAQFVFAIIPLLLLFIKNSAADKNSRILACANKIDAYDCKFILFLCVIPILIPVLLSVIFGFKLLGDWSTPLLYMFGMLFFCVKQPTVYYRRLVMFIIAMLVMLFMGFVIYTSASLFDKKAHADKYPAKLIAKTITDEWHKRYHKPLKYVAGSRYIAGYVAFYSADHPDVFVEWDQRFSQWIDLNEMKKYGAVFVQDGYYGTTVFGLPAGYNSASAFPSSVLKRFPRLEILPVQYFNWCRKRCPKNPVAVLVGFLPPDDTNASNKPAMFPR
ncbi:MAG: glycosyltransferase family 39 protein [Gammaproteobacteria bacterium]|jgi:4-amino-4-deoxy-L-arabinose transferase-like glycosyltransferase